MSWFEWLLGSSEEAEEEEARLAQSSSLAVARQVGGRRALLDEGQKQQVNHCERVFVRIYDQGLQMASPTNVAVQPKKGSLHTGVDLYGVEWSFGENAAGEPTGIVCHAPGRNVDHRLRETLSMGFTTYSPGHVRWVIDQMKVEWGPDSFNELTRNSQHFSEALCYRLGVARLPLWVKDLGDTGSPVCERVFVRVYDLGQTFLTRWHNTLAKSYGAFHTGVEVYGREWSFGMTGNDWSTGIVEHAPGQNSDHTFRETLMMGYTKYTARQVSHIVAGMKLEWKGCTYNLFSRNCHNFTNALCARLGVAPIPAWINDLASTFAGEQEEGKSQLMLT